MATLDGPVRERLVAPNVWQVATVGPDGAPQVSPIWVDLERDDTGSDGGGECVMVNTSVGRVRLPRLSWTLWMPWTSASVVRSGGRPGDEGFAVSVRDPAGIGHAVVERAVSA